jgi:opacity protein-like surface antigen
MRRLLLAAAAFCALVAPAYADIILGGQNWTGTGTALQLTPTVPGGNQPLNAPCLICGDNQPQQQAGFGYNDYKNTGNLPSVTAFSDGGAGRVTLANDTIGTGYQIGDGSLFKAFLLANGDTNTNLGFSIGIDVNDNNTPQTLNSFFFLNLTTHTVLAAFVGGTTGNLVNANNGTGFPDYTLTGFSLDGINPGDTIIFAARMSGLNDGPDSFFLEPAVVPGPVAGAGIPGLMAAAISIWGLARYRRRKLA